MLPLHDRLCANNCVFAFCTPVTYQKHRCHNIFRLLSRGHHPTILVIAMSEIYCRLFWWVCLQIISMRWLFGKRNCAHFEGSNKCCISHIWQQKIHTKAPAQPHFNKIQPQTYLVLSSWNSAAVWVIALQSLLFLSYKFESWLQNWGISAEFVSQYVLNADLSSCWSPCMCLCVCVSGRAQRFLCFMGPLLHWSTTTSTMLLWSCRARCAMFRCLLQCSYNNCFVHACTACGVSAAQVSGQESTPKTSDTPISSINVFFIAIYSVFMWLI